MTIADHVEAYVVALLGLVGEPDVYDAVAALIARDAASAWWAHVE